MRKIYNILIVLALASLMLMSCQTVKQGQYEYSERFVNRVYINTELSVYAGQVLTIQGMGFREGDKVRFSSERQEIYALISEVTENYAKFIVPDALERGSYLFSVIRGEAVQKICQISVWITTEFDIPDRPGMNIKGMVYCNKQGIEGVRVSDGVTTTTTNENGFYWLNSDKSNGYVFVVLPSGYMPMTGDNTVPGFWMRLNSDPAIHEECIFELKKVNNDNHTVMFAADLHLANRDSSNKDMTQFREGYLYEAQQFVQKYGYDSTYTIFLGDLTWDKYWYVQKYTPENFRNTMKDYPMPMFGCMGNHDNNPYVQGDFAGEAFYKSILGPNYYSINIGKIHYIILDTIVWNNTHGAEGTVGDRNFSRMLSDVQFNWFIEDLASIKDKSTPIVICTHCPIYNNYNSSFRNDESLHNSNSKKMVSALSGFENVHILTGHAHRNSCKQINSHIFENTIGAVCECWWWGGKYTGRTVCSDGSPSGYAVFEVTGKDYEWYYKGINCPREEQFRSYDMNVVKPALKPYVDVLAKQVGRDTGGDDYASVGNNVVYINVFNYDDEYTIEVKENGQDLPVTRIYERDPLHTIAYDIPRVQHGGDLTSDTGSCRSSHMFCVQCSSATSTLDIKVTDRFGHEFSEQMIRPKSFNISSK